MSLRSDFESLYKRALVAVSGGNPREKAAVRELALRPSTSPGRRRGPAYHKTGNIESTYGAGGIGRMRAVTYARMVKAFGAPVARAGADDKTAFMWIFANDAGKVFAIYDYKATRKYSRDLPTLEAFKKKPYSWSVGSNASDVAGVEFIKWANTQISLA